MHHHFSDDDEEEDVNEALVDIEALTNLPPIQPENEAEVLAAISEPQKPQFISVIGQDGEDLTQYFEKTFVAVEKILSTTLIFPVIHPRQAKQVRGKWQEDCLKVVNVLINYRKSNVCLGLAFAEQLDPDNEDLADYFKIIKQPMDFVMIMNRLYNRSYQQPLEFWHDLGLVFRNCRTYNKSTKSALRKQCDILRCLAFHLYNDWHKEMKTRFTTGIALPPQLAQTPTPPSSGSGIQNQLALQPNQPIGSAGQSNMNNRTPDFTQQQLSSGGTLDMQKGIQMGPPQSQFNQTQQQMTSGSTKINLQSLLGQKTSQQQQQTMPMSNQIDQQNQSLQQQAMLQNQQQQAMNQLQQKQPFQVPQSLPKLNQVMGANLGLGGMNQMLQQQMAGLNPQQQLQALQQLEQMQATGGPSNQQALTLPGIQQMQSNQNQAGMLPGLSQVMDNRGGFQLPSMNQISLQQQLQMGGVGNMNLFGNQNLGQFPQQQVNQFGQQGVNQMIDANQLQIIKNLPISIQEKNALINQLIAGNPSLQQQLGLGGFSQQQQLEQLQMISAQTGIQDPYILNQLLQSTRTNQGNGGQLPSLSQLGMLGGGMGSTGQLQLPSISSMNSSFMPGSNMSTFDPYGNMSMNQLQQQQQLNLLSGMQNQRGLGLPGMSTGLNSANAIDEMSLMLSMQGLNNQASLGFNQYGQKINQFQDPYGQKSGQQKPQMQGYGMNQRHPQQMMMQPKTQTTTIIDPNMIQQNDNIDNDKNDPPVPPCIYDPGQYDISWLIEQGETLELLSKNEYLTQEDIDQAVQGKNNVDQLYYVKWRGLSYTQATWEPESLIKELFDERIQDYNKYNRSLDQFQRDKLDHLIKNHKKMLRITEKKYTGHGNKRIDPQQENALSLQEAKINRQLLNDKIREVMGEAYYQVVQYSSANNAVPHFKKPHQILKDYQVQGLNWLIRAWHEHRNVVLADEMGLGKTIMTLSLFDHLNKVYKLRGPFLILAPLTTLEHWKRIADEWTSMNTVLYYDPNSAEGRQQIRHWEWFYTDITYKGTITQKSELYKFNIMITSFEVFMSDLNPILQEIPFIYIVVDEAHRLKNKQAKTLKLLKDHPCKRVLLLTGTPVQNNTKELWTLLNYIEPEKFNNMDEFLEQYGNLESFEQIQKLHKMLQPHFLRRLKEEVENSIPPLNETVVEVGLTSLQNTYYKGIYGENRMVLAKFGTNSIKSSQLNNMDVQLRKCCNHLFLLKGVEEELTRECKSEEDLYNKLLEASGKLMLLDKFIEKFKKENHKMLIFSQFKRMLDIIELYLKMKGVPYEKLTGSVKTQDRISAIQRFNDNKTPSGEGGGQGFGVFLLTTRAGGLGINLTSARVVIIFDSDWNPQNDLQAIARAHRIGQKFEVQVYRLITSKTYEEQMFERASKKLGMEQALFSKGAFNQGINDIGLQDGFQLRSLSDFKQDSKEIENLLKYGAYAFLDNEGKGDDEDIKNKDIDEILATGKKKEFSYNKGVYTLQKSTFNALKYEKGMPDFNDPEFWNKALPLQSLISISLLEKKFKKEKKEIAKNEKEQKEFIKDLEIVFNDFMDAKFDDRTSAASKKQFESDEETLREMLKKMVKLSGMKLQFVEKCKEWLREMLRTSRRKKPLQSIAQADKAETLGGAPAIEDEFVDDQLMEDDDIILYDSGDENAGRQRLLRPKKPSMMIGGDPDSQFERKKLKTKEGEEGDEELKFEEDSLNDGGQDDDFEDDEAILQRNLQRRSLRARKPAAKAAEQAEDDQIYGAEDDDEEAGFGGKRGGMLKRRSARQLANFKDDEADSNDERYGLKLRKKRQKIDKDGDVSTRNLVHQQSSTSLQDKVDSLMNSRTAYQTTKRNEKNGIVCAHCLQPETNENQCTWFCQSYCQRSFHEACKEQLFANRADSLSNSVARRKNQNQSMWYCNDCLDNVAECFCCKKKGLILVFPKKGKPKAPGSNPLMENDYQQEGMDQQDEEMEGMEQEELNLQMEACEGNNPEHSADISKGSNLEEIKQDESHLKQKVEEPIDYSNKEQQLIDPEIQQQLNQEIEQKLHETSDNIEKNPESPKQQLDQEEQKGGSSNKSGLQPSSPSKSPQRNNSDHLLERSPSKDGGEDQDQQATAMLPGQPSEEPDPNDPRYVVRCTLGGCFKYYHVKCVYKNKNVSCINSMKVQRFRCPLHYCEICQASGDSVLIVQCVACPTAYHVKCMPRGDPNAIRLTKKYVVCRKHNFSTEDFPRFEEKTNTYQVPQKVVSMALTSQLSETFQPDGKPPPKKRGRKPKSHYIAQAAQAEAAAAAAALAQQQIRTNQDQQHQKITESTITQEERHHQLMKQGNQIVEEEDEDDVYMDLGIGNGFDDDDEEIELQRRQQRYAGGAGNYMITLGQSAPAGTIGRPTFMPAVEQQHHPLGITISAEESRQQEQNEENAENSDVE